MVAPTSQDLQLIAPHLAVVVAALLVLIFSWRGTRSAWWPAGLSLLGLGAAAWLVATRWPREPLMGFSQWRIGDRVALGLVQYDGVAALACLALLAIAAMTVLMSVDEVGRHEGPRDEFFVLLLIATAAMMLLVMAADLILVFLAIETFSICLYVLAGYWRDDRRSQEAGLKYFLLGAFAAGFLLYGVALVYAATGSTNLIGVRDALMIERVSASFMVRAALSLILVGLGFKVALVPFHQWTPDVYQGAPLPVTAFMAAATKLAAFVALIRVLMVAFPGLAASWQPLLAGLAVITMTFGNLVALVQADLKRLLAYSAIAHAGYVLAAVVVGNEAGVSAALAYLIIYATMTLCAFAVLVAMGVDRPASAAGEADRPQLADLGGLARRRPGLALALAISLFGLIGLPPTAGFVGKWYIFRATVSSGYAWLAVAIVLNSALSAFYYLRPILLMVLDEGPASEPSPAAGQRPLPSGASLVVTVTAAAILLALVAGAPMVNAARDAGAMLGQSVAGAPQP